MSRVCICFAIAPLLVLTAAFGCQRAQKEEVYEIKMALPLDQAKRLLERYAQGTPLGSEVTTYPQIIEAVKKTDPQKGAILEKGLQDIQKSKSGIAGKAKDLLKQL